MTTRTVDLLVEENVYPALAESLGDEMEFRFWSTPSVRYRTNRCSPFAAASWSRTVSMSGERQRCQFDRAVRCGKTRCRPHGCHGGGCIINFSSIASDGNTGQAAYSAAKAGIEGLTQAMAMELGPLGVRVNALALGFIDVATTRRAVHDSRLQQYSQGTPLGRLGRLMRL